MENELKNKQAVAQGYLIHAIYSMIKGMREDKTITIKNRTALLGVFVVVGFLTANSWMISSIKNKLAFEGASNDKAALAYDKLQAQHEKQRGKLLVRSIGKQFYQATTLELSGGNKDEINHHINNMFSDNYERASLVKTTWVADARRAGANYVADGVELRINAFKNKDDFESLSRIVKYNISQIKKSN
tara:strand:- start:1039 stop:1602 length:564 start_codon:yes stop_codon:yes gene_type:complete